MKRTFEATLSYRIELDQVDVDRTRKGTDDPEMRSEAEAVQFLLALRWSGLVLRDVKPPSEEIDREVGFALFTWARDHMSLEEIDPGVRPVDPDVPSAARLFDVTFTHRIDLAQEEVADEVSNAVDPEAATEEWASRFLVASDWSRTVCDRIEPAGESTLRDRMHGELFDWAQDNMEIEEITDPELIPSLDPLASVVARVKAQQEKEWEAGAEKRAQEWAEHEEAIRVANSARIVDGQVRCPHCDRVFAVETIASWKTDKDWVICRPDGCNRSFDLPKRLAVCSCGRGQSVPEGKGHGICECGASVWPAKPVP
jgi:hypothetical protein